MRRKNQELRDLVTSEGSSYQDCRHRNSFHGLYKETGTNKQLLTGNKGMKQPCNRKLENREKKGACLPNLPHSSPPFISI